MQQKHRPPSSKTDRPQNAEFWESPTLEELAARQGVQPVKRVSDLLGGWPDDQLEDGFENAVAAWREAELSSAND